MNLLTIIGVGVWGALGIGLAALHFHRKTVRGRADETLTLVDGQLDPGKMAAIRRELVRLDLAVNVLTIVFVVFGLTLSFYWFAAGGR